MGLAAIYAKDRSWRARLAGSLDECHDTAGSPSWTGFQRLVLERPVTAAVVDLESLGRSGSAVGTLLRFRSRFPGLGLVVLVHRRRDPGLLFRLGTVGIHNLLLVEVEGVEGSVERSVARALDRGVASLVTRAVSSYLPARELGVLRLALDGVHRRWSAEEFADEVGLSRPFLSECLRGCGLPTTGHLLLWTRLLHAGYWLSDPGRTAESVSRQLEYCDGSAFRRALRNRTGSTPTELIRAGGFSYVLRCFLDACGFGRGEDALRRRFSAA